MGEKRRMEETKLIPEHYRLCNGDEIIAEFVGETETEIQIKRPMVVSEVTENKSNISTIVLSKYILFDDNKVFSISKNHVITKTNILDEIKKYYYNSLEYNTLFVEPSVLNEISKVNQMMERMIKDAEATSEDKVIHFPSKMSEEDQDDRFLIINESKILH
jgi:hypothetical protein